MIQRADRVVGQLVEGRTYLVPTVRGEWLDCHGIDDWPVVGVRHKDPELGVIASHYHIDLRFVPMKEFRRDGSNLVHESCDQPVRYKRWKCLQSHVILRNVTTDKGPVPVVLRHLVGAQCEGSQETGWVCPHKGTWLGSTPPFNGVVYCPSHGLGIDWRTGKIVEPKIP